MNMLLRAGLCAVAFLLGSPAMPVHAAESYDNCAGFIDSLPATVTTQGTWCLRKDLSTAMSSGNAITIATNNVTIDCNDFKLGGLAAGAGTATVGIHAEDRLNATVRSCNIRGFRHGLSFTGSNGGGHVVEDNRFDGNTWVGLLVNGDGSLVRGNAVRDTGGSTVSTGTAYGIVTTGSVDVRDNIVSGLAPIAGPEGHAVPYGIYTYANPDGSLAGNTVRGLVSIGPGEGRGIHNVNSARISLVDNRVLGSGSGTGLFCTNASGRAKRNGVAGFTTAISGCGDAGGNDLSQ